MTKTLIDCINKKTMRTSVAHYTRNEHLSRQENAALEYVRHLKNKTILDLGVGGGRTVEALRKISNDYIGLDYTNEMVVECQTKFPDVRFEHGDARDLSMFHDSSFHIVMFSQAGISMVDHKGRMNILKEVFRVLSPGGFFLFSTYNKDNPDYKKFLQLPKIEASYDPVKMTIKSLKYSVRLLIIIFNRCRFKKHEYHCDEYSIINDKCHYYTTMLYYITRQNQYMQLNKIGFDAIFSIDQSGNTLENETTEDAIFYVAQKAGSSHKRVHKNN